jgi:hypothetical protein
MDPETGLRAAQLNREAPWDAFDPHAYCQHNYGVLRLDDRQILETVRDHFTAHFRDRRTESPISGVDIGSGSNLYPVLSMLPWCRDITLYDRSAPNVEWLGRQIEHYDSNWHEFWAVLRDSEEYRSIPDPQTALSERATVQQGDIFELPSRKWNIGTMFFVAESLSTSSQEFSKAVNSFAEALAPGAPFAAAFMENSAGYTVGAQWFPACAVTVDDVEACLGPHSAELGITRIDPPIGQKIREEYTGMIIACGRRSTV